MSAAAPEILGYLAVIAALYFLARISARTRKPTPRESRIDALIESALMEGPLDEAAETFDARLLPLSDSEVRAQLNKAFYDKHGVTR